MRLRTDTFPGGADEQASELLSRAAADFDAALDDSLNTAAALGVVFDLVREANIAADAGRLGAANAAAALELLERFDRIFAVLATDSERQQGGERGGLAEGVEEKLRQRAAARQARDFALADRIRRELLEGGVIIEDTREGARWKLK